MNPVLARHAWQRWYEAAGPWRGFSICPTLLSPTLEELPTGRRSFAHDALRLADAILPLLQPGGALCLLDLDPTLGVQTAAVLAEHAHPVLVLPRWPYAAAVLPCDTLAAALVAAARTLPRGEQRLPNVVFVLDGQRSQTIPARPTHDPKADNRHALAAFELPDLGTLQARGIRRIHRFQHA